ncbi:MAG: arsenate reductase family protein [Spirochaetia bacterium]
MVNIQIIGTKKCKDTKKAQRFFKERGITPQFVNLNERELSSGEYNKIFAKLAPEECIDTESKEFKKRKMEYMVYDAEEELREDRFLLKTPIVRSGSDVFIGNAPDSWETLISK